MFLVRTGGKVKIKTYLSEENGMKKKTKTEDILLLVSVIEFFPTPAG